MEGRAVLRERQSFFGVGHKRSAAYQYCGAGCDLASSACVASPRHNQRSEHGHPYWRRTQVGRTDREGSAFAISEVGCTAGEAALFQERADRPGAHVGGIRQPLGMRSAFQTPVDAVPRGTRNRAFIRTCRMQSWPPIREPPDCRRALAKKPSRMADNHRW